MTTSVENDLASGRLADVLAETAEAAGRVILPYWRSGLVADRKADDSPVTRADREAETLILDRLRALWPDVPAVAEEDSALNGAPVVEGEWFWLIDPLDGTRGFVEGRDGFTVNIALMRDLYPVAGVVSAPALARTWRSAPSGAQRRDFDRPWQPIAVRPRPERPFALMSQSLTAEQATALAARHGCVDWRAQDSSLKFCLIAQGDCDAYPRLGPTSEWDTAAGQAVLEAAGGRVLGADGDRLAYRKPGWANTAFTALGGL